MTPLIGLALKLAPTVIGMFTGRKQELVAKQVIEAAKELTGQGDEQKALEIIQADPALAKELAARANEVALAEIQAQSENLKDVNATIRSGLVSSSMFKSGWRPSFGWSMTFCFTLWVLVTLGSAAYWINADPKDVVVVIDALSRWITAWLVVWGVAFAVLGVNISNRSRDKQTAAGLTVPGLISSLLRR